MPGVIAVLRPALTGATEAFAAATVDGDSFANDGSTVLHVKNASGAPVNVTVAAAKACNFGVTHDVVVAVPAGADRVIGPFPQDHFGSTAQVTYSAVTSITVAAVRAA